MQSLRWLLPPDQPDKLVRLRSFDPASSGGDLDVPDPYYDGPAGFESVLRLVEAACDGLLAQVRARLDGQRSDPADRGTRLAP